MTLVNKFEFICSDIHGVSRSISDIPITEPPPAYSEVHNHAPYNGQYPVQQIGPIGASYAPEGLNTQGPSPAYYPPPPQMPPPGLPAEPAPPYTPYNAGYDQNKPIPVTTIHPGPQAPPTHVLVQANQVQPNPSSIPDYSLFSVIVCLLCCWPLGLVAIMRSHECKNAKMRGDVQSALKYSRQARNLCCIGLALGLVCIILVTVMLIMNLSLAYSYP